MNQVAARRAAQTSSRLESGVGRDPAGDSSRRAVVAQTGIEPDRTLEGPRLRAWAERGAKVSVGADRVATAGPGSRPILFASERGAIREMRATSPIAQPTSRPSSAGSGRRFVTDLAPSRRTDARPPPRSGRLPAERLLADGRRRTRGSPAFSGSSRPGRAASPSSTSSFVAGGARGRGCRARDSCRGGSNARAPSRRSSTSTRRVQDLVSAITAGRSFAWIAVSGLFVLTRPPRRRPTPT